MGLALVSSVYANFCTIVLRRAISSAIYFIYPTLSVFIPVITWECISKSAGIFDIIKKY